jgi:hypothetical protein
MNKFINGDLFQYKPDEQSGESASGSADQPAALPKTVVVDGKEIDVQAAIHDHINKRDWQAAQTQRDQQISAERTALNEFASKLVDKLSPGATSQQTEVATQVVNETIDSLVEEMPDPVEDKEAFKKWQRSALTQVQQAAKQQAVKEAEQIASRTSSAASAVTQSDSISNQVVNDNLRMVDDRVRELYPDLSASDKQRLITEIDGLKASSKYAQPVRLPDGRVAHRFNEASVEAAAKLMGISPKATVSTTRATSTSPAPATITEPKPNAPVSEKVTWLRSLSERELDRAFTRMSAKEKSEIGSLLTAPP